MGIKNLRVILNQNCKNAINVRKLNVYSGMKVAIDLSIFLYKYLYNNNDHIEGLTRLILRLLKNQITPLFVFDGIPPEEKNITIQERKEKKEILTLKKTVIEYSMNTEKNDINKFKSDIRNIISKNATFKLDEDEMKELFVKSRDDLEFEFEKIKRKIIYVTSYHIETSKKLFDLFGIPYIHENCEAESLMSLLSKNNIVHACISEDMDTLPCGTTLLLKSFSADKSIIEEYCLDGILSNLELTQDEFIDVCILCGCDYTEKINLLGPVSALKIIKKYKNIEAFLKENTKYIIPEHFINNYQKARYLFNNPVSDDIYTKINKKIICTKPNIDGLKDFLKNCSLKDKYYTEIDEQLMNYYITINGIYYYDDEINNDKIIEKNNKKNDNVKLKKITDFFKKDILKCDMNKEISSRTIVEENTMNLSKLSGDKELFSGVQTKKNILFIKKFI
jgi:flap endonuclease-1